MFWRCGQGKRLYSKIAEKYKVVAFVDNDSNKWGDELYQIPIYAPTHLNKMEYYHVVITSAPGMESIKEQCLNMRILEEKIITAYIETPLESRRIFLKTLAMMPEIKKLPGACVEAGVFEGDFAKYINEYFPDRALYLFDTFDGFDVRDIAKEAGLSEASSGEYNNTSVETVMRKMPNPSTCMIYKDYFPESAEDLNENFVLSI